MNVGPPNGMAQLTPYPDGFFQLHGMTEDITLFRQGLASSTTKSAQPELGSSFIRKLKHGWTNSDIDTRTDRAIKHMAQFVPAYHTASIGGKHYSALSRSLEMTLHSGPLISLLQANAMRELK